MVKSKIVVFWISSTSRDTSRQSMPYNFKLLIDFVYNQSVCDTFYYVCLRCFDRPFTPVLFAILLTN